MHLLIGIALNALILFVLAMVLPYDEAAKTGVMISSESPFLTYFIGGVVLGILNTVLRPILSILGFPFQIITFGAFTLVINAIMLFALTWTINALNISGVLYDIHGSIVFAIAVAIFSLLNTLLGVFRR